MAISSHSPTLIQAKEVTKKYVNNTVLDRINLEVKPGEFTALLGPSGSGKSTLLRILSGLETPTSGSVEVNIHRRERAFVFQDPTLLPWLNVIENVEFPFRILGERPKGAVEALSKVGLSGSQNLFPHQLSGGMRMRVAVARALVTKPKLLFMDEPFAALDESTRFELQEDLFQLWLQEKLTVVFVTHSISEAVYLAERVCILSPKGGGIFWDQRVQLPEVRGPQIRTNYEFNGYVELLGQKLRSLKYV